MDVSQNDTSGNQPILKNSQEKRVSRIRKHCLMTSTVCREARGIRISESYVKKTMKVFVVLLMMILAAFFVKST